MKEIELRLLFHDVIPTEYKVHFARKSGNGTEPLDDYRLYLFIQNETLGFLAGSGGL